ncbi:uncharacterized protein [Lolium perenne]|uniref:uncharacterized protein isoform X1 n=1 Tax=Lolium perenne TaxID=4522 RepID=UPI003A991821
MAMVHLSSQFLERNVRTPNRGETPQLHAEVSLGCLYDEICFCQGMWSEDHNNVYALLHAVAHVQGVQAHGSKKKLIDGLQFSSLFLHGHMMCSMNWYKLWPMLTALVSSV